RRHQALAILRFGEAARALAERIAGAVHPVEPGIERLALQPARGIGGAGDVLTQHIGIGAAEARLAPGKANEAGAVLDERGLAEGESALLRPRRTEAEGAMQAGEQG